jgi:hypothetical protein
MTDTDNAPDDFNSIINDGFSMLSLYLFITVVLIYIIFNTTIFNEVLLSVNKSLIKGECCAEKSTKGIVVTGILFGLLIAMFQALSDKNLI